MVKSRVTDAPTAVDGRCRVVIGNVRPEVDNGRYPIKRTVGETVTVEADVFVDGHDKNGWQFNEWFHGKTGKSSGMTGQSWNAATFLLVQHAMNRKIF